MRKYSRNLFGVVIAKNQEKQLILIFIKNKKSANGELPTKIYRNNCELTSFNWLSGTAKMKTVFASSRVYLCKLRANVYPIYSSFRYLLNPAANNKEINGGAPRIKTNCIVFVYFSYVWMTVIFFSMHKRIFHLLFCYCLSCPFFIYSSFFHSFVKLNFLCIFLLFAFFRSNKCE